MKAKPSPAVSNRQIVRELKEGTRIGYKHLTEIYRTRLLHEAVNAYRIDCADAEEIVNDVLLLVSSRIVGFEFKNSDSDFRSWVLTILRNRVRDHLRRSSASRYEKTSLDDAIVRDDSFSLHHDNGATVSILRGLQGQSQEGDESVGQHRNISQLTEILEAMPVWEQVLLRCRALEIPYEEIAIYTGKSAAVLKVYHARVQKKLRREIERRFPHFLANERPRKQ